MSHKFSEVSIQKVDYSDAVARLANSETGFYMPDEFIRVDEKPMTEDDAQDYLNQMLNTGSLRKDVAYVIPIVDDHDSRIQDYDAGLFTVDFDAYYNTEEGSTKSFTPESLLELIKPQIQEWAKSQKLTLTQIVINQSPVSSEGHVLREFSEPLEPKTERWVAQIHDDEKYCDTEEEALSYIKEKLAHVDAYHMLRKRASIVYLPAKGITSKEYVYTPQKATYQVSVNAYLEHLNILNDAWNFYTFKPIY